MRFQPTIATFLAPALLVVGSFARAGETTCVSTDAAGAVGDGRVGDFRVALDAGARQIFFESSAYDLVPGDTNGVSDIFVKDLGSGGISRVVLDAGGPEPDKSCRDPDVSPDGRYVVFTSAATNLVKGDKNGQADVFLVDRKNRTIERVSVADDGSEADGYCAIPHVSDDGRFVLFTSPATTLVPKDTAGTADVFLRDRKSATTSCVSVDLGNLPGTGDSFGSGLTGDGSVAVFSSSSPSLVKGDKNGRSDCFLRELGNGVTERLSVAPDGSELDGASMSPCITDDLQWVVFDCYATNLVPGTSNSRRQIYLIDRSKDVAYHCSRSSAGEIADDDSYVGRIGMRGTSGDEPVVVFLSYATNLAYGVTGSYSGEPWAHRPLYGTTQILDLASDGTPGDGNSLSEVVPSADGASAFFATDSSNLDAADDNGLPDIYRRELLWTAFAEFGTGHAGTGGFVPHLFGYGGSCEAGGCSIHVEDGRGFTVGLLWAGIATTDVPAFGGRFYVDLSQPYLALPITLGGSFGVGGAGFLDLAGGDVSEVGALTIYLQAGFVDPGASRNVSLTNGLQLDIGK